MLSTSQARQYEEDAKRCCHDGMMDFPLDYSCEKRSHYITEGPKCVEAFLRCCQGIQKDQIRFTTPELILARSKSILSLFFCLSLSDIHFIGKSIDCVNINVYRVLSLAFSSSILFHFPEANEYFFDEDEEDIIIRSKFDVSWMWTTILLSGNETDAG